MGRLEDVHACLARVRYPGYQRDVVSFGMVRDVEVREGCAIVLLDAASGDAAVLDELRTRIARELASVAGITAVDVRLVGADAARAAARNPFDETAPLPGVRDIVAVASGKGGVGKSTVAVNLALAFGRRGVRTGLLDADIYGPSVPLMMGVPDARPRMTEGKKIFPIEQHGIRLISMGFFLDDRSPVIWRGPMVMSIVRQFLLDVVWGELDVLVVDLPPGTGDAQLTLLQQVPVAGGVIVTTPQDVALQDVKRGIAMFQTVNAPVFGIVENMSVFVCPECGTRDDVFGHGGGAREAAELGIPLLGEIPLVETLRASMDSGMPLVVASPEHDVARRFDDVATRVLGMLESARDDTRSP